MVIFDMDGVIFDSERCVYNGWKEIANKYGFEWQDEAYWKCIGVNATASKKIFLESYGKDFPYDEYKEEQRMNYHKKYDGGNLPLKPGVHELLEYLKANGHTTAIASSTKTETVRNQIRDAGLLEYFDVIVGGDQVQRSKPNPDIFLEAARLLNAKPDECIVIEDSYNGIRAAKAANMKPIMVPDMLEPDEEMKSIAWMVIDNLLAVKEFLAADMHMIEESN